MRIKSLSLDNIRSYTQQTIVFSDGITLLSGDIGCGKSTILQAIEFALFGTIRSELDAASLLRNGESKGSVLLTLQVDSSTYGIFRSLKRSKTAISQDVTYLEVNGVREDLAPTELKAKILKLLSYPIDFLQKKPILYRYTVYTPQETMKEILTESSENRLQTLRVIFGIDKYKRISVNAQSGLRFLREKIAHLQGSSEGREQIQSSIKNSRTQLEELLSGLSIYEKQVSLIREKRNSIEKNITQKKKVISELQESITQLKVAQSKQDSLKVLTTEYLEKIKIIRSQMEQIQEKIQSFPSQKPDAQIADQYDAIIHKLTILDEKIELEKKEELEYKKKLEIYTQKRTEYENQKKRLPELQEQKNSLLEKKTIQEQKRESIQEFKVQLERLKAKRESIQERIKKRATSTSLLSDSNTCPTCLQPLTLDHIHKINAGISIEEKSDEKALEVVSQKIQSFEKEIEQYDISLLSKVIEKIDRASEQIIQCASLQAPEKPSLRDTNVQLLQEEHAAFQKEREKIKKAYIEYEKKLEQYGRRDLLLEKETELQSQKTQLQNDCHSFQKEMENLGVIISKHSPSIELLDQKKKILSQQEIQYAAHQNEFENVFAKVSAINAQKGEIEKQQIQLTSDLEKKNLAYKDLQKYEQKKFWLQNTFIPLMDNLEKHVFTSVYRHFSQLFQKWFAILLDDQTLTIRLDTSFSPQLEQNGYDISLSHLSGGERTSVALAYRLALNSVVNTFHSSLSTKDILILDEPTEGFSSEQLDKVRDVLQLLDIPQILLVSHEQKMESVADTIITITKHNHTSAIL